MPNFFYTTMDSGGKEVSGAIEAVNISAAAGSLRSQGKFITSLKETGEVMKKGEKLSLASLLDYISFIRSSDIVILFRQFSALITSGVTLVNSLQILQRQTKKRKLKQLLGQILADIEEGSTFADALKKHPRTFSSFIVNMVESGEVGGTLDIVLESIANRLEERSAFRAQVITSFIYPTIVIVMSIIVIGFLVGFVIPRFMPFILARGGELPWNTQFLLDSTHWLRSYWVHIIGTVAGGAVGVYLLGRFDTTKYWMDRLKIKIPIVGSVFAYSVVVQFSRNLASLLTSGVSMLESLRTVRNTLGNYAAMQVVDAMEKRVSRGENLSAPVRDASFIFPPMVAEMIAVGEETGGMDDALNLTAQIHEKLLQTYVKRMNSMIEPVLILVLGGIVGFVAWSLIAGILAMYGV
ncbi:type II secretion system F family protein [Thermodesulfovibrionales bacterium]|nr:type II secretion system F family protein [Thermodesulfovibrionales bacterium]